MSQCTEQGTGPGQVPELPCEDADSLVLPRFTVTKHKHPQLIHGEEVVVPGVQWADGDSVEAFFGGKEIRLVFTLNKQLFYLTYRDKKPVVTRLSQGNENIGANGEGSINSPLISPDGKRVVYAGNTRGKPTFVQELAVGAAEVWRTPIDPLARTTADPHWLVQDGKTWIYFATLSGLVNYNDRCGQIAGSTYRIEMLGDTVFGKIEITGIPGAYRGGISRDGKYAGTSYAASAIYDRDADSTRLILPNEQQCNPSMNPFAPGSRNTDLMMVLAFGGSNYPLVTGDSVTEGIHENLWIYNKRNEVVWQAKRPDEKKYVLYDKPEWSTHPDYATATAMRRADEQGDLIVVRIGDLADAELKTVKQAGGYFKLAEGGLNRDSYTHLWVAP